MLVEAIEFTPSTFARMIGCHRLGNHADDPGARFIRHHVVDAHLMLRVPTLEDIQGRGQGTRRMMENQGGDRFLARLTAQRAGPGLNGQTGKRGWLGLERHLRSTWCRTTDKNQ